MIPTYVFILMAVLACLLLLCTTVAAVIGAINVFSSTTYNGPDSDNTSRARDAHKYLTIAAALGGSSLATLTIILIVTGLTGGFSTVNISKQLLTTKSPSKDDLLAAYKGEKELSSGHTIQIILIIILIIVAIITLATGILAMLAAIKLAGVSPREPNINTAYIASIIAAIAALGGIGMIIVAIVSYFSIRQAKKKQLIETQEFVEITEKKLGVKASVPPEID